MFRSIAGGADLDTAEAIPNYLEKVFKQKEADKKKRKMMGEEIETVQDKIERFEADTTETQYVDVSSFKEKKMKQYM